LTSPTATGIRLTSPTLIIANTKITRLGSWANNAPELIIFMVGGEPMCVIGLDLIIVTGSDKRSMAGGEPTYVIG
jgi:hypothetical protein